MAQPEPFPEHISLGEKYGPAMTIDDQAAASAYFERCVEHQIRAFGSTRAEAEEIEKANLGYWAGYYDNATRERVERLFSCAHPYFGKIAEVGPPTPAEALAAGIERGLKLAGRS
ncbi:hypothetical protein [Bradyrhizobium sp. 188]|uniref:hypothetical protein n=1 Tax=Bradyrhizobium sp. 188 TaxID=2782656 RepID=UPI001FFAE56F|nr:hypothetical protein [Bradyrhizobium sp. 188]MCK1501535.1 hypothetical protein [Bradyrhizobium sp. 188]